jgi:hypothetical protein
VSEYTRDSLERALIHHGIDYSPPEAGRIDGWRIHMGTRTLHGLRGSEVYFYCCGLADKERQTAAARAEENLPRGI